jgi:hypothetical protein
VEVPQEFQEIGYSGEFWMDAVLADDVDVEEWRAKVPCLLGNTGWMALAIVEHPESLSMRCVRRDSDAIWEALTARRPR